MTRQRYFPNTVDARPGWFHIFATELAVANAVLGLPAPDVTAIIADAKFLEYAGGPWLTAAREFGPACTAALEDLYAGTGTVPCVLPVFTVPALPAGVVAVLAGALARIFAFVQTIKASPNYTDAIGLQLGIIGPADGTPGAQPLPAFTLKTERGTAGEAVKIVFKKYGRQGVVIFSKRGSGGWEMLAIDLSSPYLDDRPLLVAGQPEVREYRLQFYDDSAPVGDFTDVASATVAP